MEKLIIKYLRKNNNMFIDEVRLYKENGNPIMLTLINLKFKRLLGFSVDEDIIKTSIS